MSKPPVLDIIEYAAKIEPKVTLVMPEFAEVLTCLGTPSGFTIWVLADSAYEPEARTFYLYHSGQNVPTNPGHYIETVFDGRTHYHIFERTF